MVDELTVFEYSLKNKRFSYIQDKLMEEMTELMQGIFKAREKGREYSDNIEEEFSDVNLMMKQVRYFYDHMTNGEFSKNIKIYEQAKCNKLWDIWHDENLIERNDKC
jgi:CRISPR/Cas system CSM-associated protein Csm2 small subunit